MRAPAYTSSTRWRSDGDAPATAFGMGHLHDIVDELARDADHARPLESERGRGDPPALVERAEQGARGHEDVLEEQLRERSRRRLLSHSSRM